MKGPVPSLAEQSSNTVKPHKTTPKFKRQLQIEVEQLVGLYHDWLSRAIAESYWVSESQPARQSPGNMSPEKTTPEAAVSRLLSLTY